MLWDFGQGFSTLEMPLLILGLNISRHFGFFEQQRHLNPPSKIAHDCHSASDAIIIPPKILQKISVATIVSRGAGTPIPRFGFGFEGSQSQVLGLEPGRRRRRAGPMWGGLDRMDRFS
uniref:Uncharacterized protein n=1 Tax=Desulfobacca acetoxidans TaxID=60893 RepID=A0A7C3YZI8_9BACT